MTTDGVTRTLGRLGLAGLLVAVIIGFMAPVIGGHGSTGAYERVRLEPGASVPLAADHVVELDSGDGTTRIGDCSIIGPADWSHQVVATGRTTTFNTGAQGDYRITCQGGAVEVEDNTGVQHAADPTPHQGDRGTIVAFVIAGVVGVLSLGLLIASARGGDRRGTTSAGPDRTKAEADEPKAF